MRNRVRRRTGAVSPATQEEVQISAGPILLDGTLEMPANCSSLVLFAHGSGSSRFSSRNRSVARELSSHGIGALLFDLLTAEEDASYQNRFDIDLLTTRLLHAAAWVHAQAELKNVWLGLFGASTGAAAALKAAAVQNDVIHAVVSRGGRPDLAGDDLALVRCPTLLIVGGRDYDVLRLNRNALEQLACEKELAVVPGATHLFEEAGTLEQAARLAREWFERYL